MINGGGEAVSTENGEVVLNVGPLVEKIGGEVGIPSGLLEKLPPEAGELKVLNSDQLSTVQSIAKLIRHLPIVLILLMIILYAGAIYLARGRRREALRAVGIAFVVAGVLALVLRGIAGNAIVDALANDAVKPAAEGAWAIATSLLVTVASSVIVFGVLLFIGAWLAGPTELAKGLRQEASPFLRDYPLGAYAIAFLVWLALIAWAPVAAFHKPLGILIFAVLFAIGAELIRRQTLEEFPDSQGGALSGRLKGMRRGGGGGDSSLKDLERLGALRRDGTLTDEEFEQRKTEILSRPT